LRVVIHELKFSGRRRAAARLAQLLLETEATHRLVATSDVLVAVPLHPRRLRERGFNQAAEIARALALESGIPLGLEVGRRTLEAPPQSTLPWKERQKNVRGAFDCGAELSGKVLLVVDDVMTTGATLGEFARVLKDHGATRVIACVAARAVKGSH
jgi:ComF family protein